MVTGFQSIISIRFLRASPKGREGGIAMRIFVKLAGYIKERGVDLLLLLLSLAIIIYSKVFRGKEVNN